MVHSSARSPLEVGTLIAETYTVERIIGRGGMGAVFLASHARLPGKQVAIKVLHADVADAESLARFRREAEIASRLGHPNIVEVHDFNVLPDGTPYLVLEFLHGESLAQRLARGPLSVEHTYTILRQIGSALAAAHREDIVHRDLKPANVFLVPTETDGQPSERAKVLDFGISKIRGSQTIKTQDTSILGTPQYMAPEQALGNHAAVDGRTDVFALGAMVYEMLCGKPAFGGASVPEVVFKVVYEEPPPLAERVSMLPAHVVVAVHRAMAKKPDDRYPDVVAFVEALTGQPLATGKRPLITSPDPAVLGPKSDKVSSREALGATIGSGDHAQAAQVISGVEATMASGAHPPVAAISQPPRTLDEAAVPAASGLAATVAAPTSGGKAKLVIGAVLILALAAVAIVFLMTRPKGEPKDAGPIATAVIPDAAAAPVIVAIDAAPAPVVDAAVTPIDAAAVKVDARPKDKVDAAVKVGSGTGTGTGSDDDEGDEATSSAAECLGMISDDPEAAIKCASRMLTARPSNANAFLVKGIAYCALDDVEKALGMLRRLAAKPKLRKRLISGCKAQDVELNN